MAWVKKAIRTCVAQIRQQIEEATSDYDREKTAGARSETSAGGVAVISWRCDRS